MTIEQLARKRGIKYLTHFTRVENLRDILTHGLLPKSLFCDYSVAPTINDALRLDGYPDASCLSIGFPNYKMFFACRQKDKAARWVVLAIDPRVLWDKNCAFCIENAASSAVTAVPVAYRRTRDAFARMFDEYPGKPRRAELRISDDLPTNPQAEVLVFDRIEPELIIGVAFNDANLIEAYKAYSKGRQLKHIPALYSPRSDYPHWK